jgi:hypothetical protein
MHVILDWVGNHTAWDHPWATEHPDWYKKNDKGEIASVSFKTPPAKPKNGPTSSASITATRNCGRP